MVFKNNKVAINNFLANLSINKTIIDDGSYGIIQARTPAGTLVVTSSSFTRLSQNAIYVEYCASQTLIKDTTFSNNTESNVYTACPVSFDNVR
eukprot:CAMPEP_0184367792 /NCGR_PEP_ID=MMETSP1089-20130417/159885_1 /TAXON_ID=38269 ORGANISM="Gloeochaete wittrockiana, Strain SAG46.84" /NCGR_SAMPLE_ID=MMETSP1089 /ASSEMBLY_ACC=CAM_ASM_000445 /LENGTH=92 /DNA_ID=CAMNT_0026709899 /DNA_START=5 /DNA_END=280 /DNA_ORIENTATION=-